jgi:hypothetical protein
MKQIEPIRVPSAFWRAIQAELKAQDERTRRFHDMLSRDYRIPAPEKRPRARRS